MARFSIFALLAVPWLMLMGLVAGDVVQDLEKKGRPALDALLAKSKTCTKANLRVRKEWGSITAAEKKEYIAALQCLLQRPSKLDQAKFPGAKSRYDDFVVVHMNQTMFIHGTGSFLTWHRYYLWAFEEVLRKECGYTGSHPYWDWGRWSADPEKSPIFDGSDTSLGGNGKKIQHKASMVAPAGNGGGCVETGPFKNMTVYLGPVSPAIDPPPPNNPRSDGYGSNPRCLRRDISNQLTSKYTRPQDIASLINSRDLATFQNVMQGAGGFGFGGGGMGVHSAGHYTIGGDPGGDFYTSPNDPAFWVHHGMIDRVWVIWQTQDMNNRVNIVSGGTSMMGFGGRQQSLDDPIDLGVVADKVYKIRDLVSIVDGPFCYVYE
ncbi:hypothetical protein QBC38DRAFT_467267 [Podospora fimiseda]|uniref:Tyrosinase copper-binding domain-containing protein n=1 Tax=Podospora fimiseda TaxID=252190 RepID=A0AAN7H0K3_9PEZI|nr:hypothetical protein QBC38DRAFT_467267 [Podospora fimiseda]